MKTILITGTTRGIGKALAEKFVREGWFVVGTSFSGVNLPDSDQFTGYDLDLSSPQSIVSFTDEVLKKYTRLDVIINNAGVCLDEFDTSADIKKVRDTLEVNVLGPLDLTQRLLPLLAEGSQVFNMSSTAGMLSKPLEKCRLYPAYKISKAALNMYTRTLGAQLQEKGIFVASVHPGWVKTDIGGQEADFTPEESASYIYDFTVKEKSVADTGLFWFKGERLEW